jgi:hypothetical protein
MKKMNPCIHACGRDTSSESGECSVCKSGLYYWRKKTVGDRIKRRKQLDVLSSRMDTHFDTRGKINDAPLVQPAPKKTTAKVIMFRERRRAS